MQPNVVYAGVVWEERSTIGAMRRAGYRAVAAVLTFVALACCVRGQYTCLCEEPLRRLLPPTDVVLPRTQALSLSLKWREVRRPLQRHPLAHRVHLYWGAT